MASEGVEDWDLPLPPSVHSSLEEEEGEEEENQEEVEYNRKDIKLQEYLKRMSYRPVTPPLARERTEQLNKPKDLILKANYEMYHDVYSPHLRGQRMKRITDKYRTITSEQLESIVQELKQKDFKKEDLLKRKQEIYYSMLTKLERQCRTQYLDVLVKKFSNFIAKLATTMPLPISLAEPYSRMQRGLFCNILLAIGVQPTNQSAIYYNTTAASEYEVLHKLAHALLSLIIKALDAASQKNPEDIPTMEAEFDMDNYIKDRLMCAAEKKINHLKNQGKTPLGAKSNMSMPSRDPLMSIFKSCELKNPIMKKCCNKIISDLL